ncbi:MAG: REP-associated tyrosine transposase [Opitutaceae bacterium]
MSCENDSLPDRRRPLHFPAVEFDNRSIIYFVTVCTKERATVLGTAEAHDLIIDAWKEARAFLVGRYVIMPDHVHFFCSPGTWPPAPLGRWMAFWKSCVARRWPVPAPVSGKLWQRDFWDTQLRLGDSYSAKWEYVRNNPVRAGLVSSPDEWPFQGEVNTLRWHE